MILPTFSAFKNHEANCNYIYFKIKQGLDVKDYGDILYKTKDVCNVNNMSHLGDVASCTSCLSEQVQKVLNDSRRVLTIGGDHSLGIGTIDGHVKV